MSFANISTLSASLTPAAALVVILIVVVFAAVILAAMTTRQPGNHGLRYEHERLSHATKVWTGRK